MGASGPLPSTVQRAVEDALTVRFRTPVRVAGVEEFPYSRVSRCFLEAASGMVPATVIIRVLRDDPTRSGPARLHHERAALELLQALGSTLVPRCLASDAAAGILLTEDLGSHPSLLDLLLGTDPVAARQGLLAFARGLGTLHAQTAGWASAYADRRAPLGLVEPEAEEGAVHVRVVAAWRQVGQAVSQLGLPHPGGVDNEVEEVARVLAAPGPYLALSSGDPSPVNCKVVGGAVRFFDFEDAGFRHALIDAAVLRYLYPIGGPAWRLPPMVAEAVEPAYRGALARACAAARDEAGYERGMAAACAAWTILRLARLTRVEAGPDRNPWLLVPPGWTAPIPSRSRRRQLVAIMETGIASARRAATLEALAAWLDRMVEALHARWPEAREELPLYPAFE